MVILYQYANAVIFLCSRVSGQPGHATAPALMSLEATRTIVRGRQPRSGLMCILCKLMFLCSRGKRLTRTLSYVLMSLCSSFFRVSGQPSHATAPALMSLEATRTIIRGRQPCSGLMCILCKLYVPAVSGKHKRYILCPYVLLFPALVAYAPSNKQAMVRRVTLPH